MSKIGRRVPVGAPIVLVSVIGIIVMMAAACGKTDTTASTKNPTPVPVQTTTKPGAAPGAANTAGGVFTAAPVQLTADPCALVTKTEADRAIGQELTLGSGYAKGICRYGGNAGFVGVTLESPALCKLLFLALDKNLFGADQLRVDDVGQGGMLIKGEGNVQFVVKGGCVTVEATLYQGKVADAVVLDLARGAAKRA